MERSGADRPYRMKKRRSSAKRPLRTGIERSRNIERLVRRTTMDKSWRRIALRRTLLCSKSRLQLIGWERRRTWPIPD